MYIAFIIHTEHFNIHSEFIYFSSFILNFDLSYVAQRYIKLKSLGSLTKAKLYVYRHSHLPYCFRIHSTHTYLYVINIKSWKVECGSGKVCFNCDEYISALRILIGWWVERILIVVSPREYLITESGKDKKKERVREIERKKNTLKQHNQFMNFHFPFFHLQLNQ